MAFRLIPRDQGFFPLFDELALVASECAQRLQKMFSSTPLKLEDVDWVVAQERRGDDITHRIRGRLETSIVTPFDREDIQELVNRLDDVIDDIRAAADTAYLHHVSSSLPGLQELNELLVQITAANIRCIATLVTLKESNAIVDEIDRMESEADAAYRRVTAELFSGRFDALEVLKWKDVVEAVERSIDAVEKASDIVQAIAIKHA